MVQIKKQYGFTIVETLIVLAVTGVFFIATSTLIQGQVERNRYQDSMRQLQALFQTTINDVEDGYMANTGGTDGSTILIGKRYQLCADASYGCFDATTNTELYTDTMTQVVATGAKSTTSPSKQPLPAGIKFIGSKAIFDENTATTWNGEFTTTVLLTDINGKTGKDITAQSSSRMYDISGSNLLTAYNGGKGFLLCFEGWRKGSIEFGNNNVGTTVIMKPLDERCN